ncbi:MAG: Hpt domain-containing protein, partial [Proteobacteria bacterium]|nr:Hpt domain-containing protein [Pseudomonadota bacterium]
MFEDDETLQMYIEESLDHLGDIETDLLTIEEGGENIDLDLVNNVFRAAHSVKGGAGFMGLTTIKDLAHHLENVLGLIRNGELVPTSNRISVLLKGFDELENLLKNIDASNDVDVSGHIAALESITKSSLPEEKQDTVSKIVDIVLQDGRIFQQISLYEIEKYKSEGKNLFLVEYDLINDIQRKEKNPIEVLNSLEKTGTIVDSRIDFDSVGTLTSTTSPARIPFQVLFASIIEYDMAETLFDINKRYIHAITDNMIVASTVVKTDPQPMPTPARDVSQVQAKPQATKAAIPKAVSTEPVPQKAAAPIAAAPVANDAVKEKTGEKELLISGKPQTSLRVNVGLLDTLMNLAGELVLSRNQLLQGISSSNAKATEISGQRIDMITSELQEAIMRTRMQPISNILNKFTRVVR